MFGPSGIILSYTFIKLHLSGLNPNPYMSDVKPVNIFSQRQKRSLAVSANLAARPEDSYSESL